MSSESKVKPSHLSRCAYVYVRQSSPAQVERNRESTDRQYKLVERALALGWGRPQVKVIDEDLAHSAASRAGRGGFATMTAEVRGRPDSCDSFILHEHDPTFVSFAVFGIKNARRPEQSDASCILDTRGLSIRGASRSSRGSREVKKRGQDKNEEQ